MRNEIAVRIVMEKIELQFHKKNIVVLILDTVMNVSINVQVKLMQIPKILYMI